MSQPVPATDLRVQRRVLERSGSGLTDAHDLSLRGRLLTDASAG